MKHFLFLTVFLGCFVISKVRASEQGQEEKKTLSIFWIKKKNGQERIEISCDLPTVTLASLKAAVKDKTKIRSKRQALTVQSNTQLETGEFVVAVTPLNSRSGFDDQKKLQKILAGPGAVVTLYALKHKPDMRKHVFYVK